MALLRGAGKGKSARKEVTVAEERPQKKKKTKRVRTQTYNTYLRKVLKQLHPKLSISQKALSIMNHFMTDMFEKISQEASRLARYSKKPTIGARAIESAVRLTLRGELAKNATAEGTKALSKFNEK